MSDKPQRPLPLLDSENRDFWTGGAEGELRIMKCGNCSTHIHPPRPVCNNCLSENVAPAVVSGLGRVDTFTVNHQKWHPGMEPPYVIARVTLDDAPGVYLTTNIVGCDIDEVDIGDAVKVKFEQCDDVYLPLFEKV